MFAGCHMVVHSSLHGCGSRTHGKIGPSHSVHSQVLEAPHVHSELIPLFGKLAQDDQVRRLARRERGFHMLSSAHGDTASLLRHVPWPPQAFNKAFDTCPFPMRDEIVVKNTCMRCGARYIEYFSCINTVSNEHHFDRAVCLEKT